MAATGTPTPNIGLRIPQGTDPASVDDINYNSNLLDTKLGAVGNDSVQDQIDSLNSKIFNYTSVTVSSLTGYSVVDEGTKASDLAIRLRCYIGKSGGSIISPAVTSSIDVASIPSNYAPANTQQYVVPVSDGSSMVGWAIVGFRTDGTIYVSKMSTAGYLMLRMGIIR